MPKQPPVIVIGAGVAGLCCARRLHQAGKRFFLFEAEDGPGGRVRTDCLDGFRLDRGFQVLLTAYPDARKQLDYERLRLCRFTPGAFVRKNGRFYRLADPWRRPFSAIKTLASPIGSLADKIRIGKLRSRSKQGNLEELWNALETTTLRALREYGFSEGMIDSFFRPFLGGVFLERDLETSSRMLHFVFRMFSLGETALPSDGIGAIPTQLAGTLPAEVIRFKTPVQQIDDDQVVLETGERLSASAIVIATGGRATAKLLHQEFADGDSRGVTCVYFAASRAPIEEPILILDGDGEGPVNNLSVPSRVAPETAPAGQHLISATILENSTASDAELEAAVRSQMNSWFGSEVDEWRHLRTYHIRDALPNQAAGRQRLFPDGRVRPVTYVCGDFAAGGSLQAAMVSGREVADAVLKELAAVDG